MNNKTSRLNILVLLGVCESAHEGKKRQFTQPTIVCVTTSHTQIDHRNKAVILSFVCDVIVNHNRNELSFMSIT